MINESMADCVVNQTGILHATMLKSLFLRYKKGRYEECAELAVAYMQLMLCGDTCCDDEEVLDFLEAYRPTAKKSLAKYSAKVAKTREAKAAEMRLEDIAALMGEGKSVRAISDELDIPRATVQYRETLIENEYQELLGAKAVDEDESGVQVSKCPDEESENTWAKGVSNCPSVQLDKDKDKDKDWDKDKDIDNRSFVAEGAAEVPSFVDEDGVVTAPKMYRYEKGDYVAMDYKTLPWFCEPELNNFVRTPAMLEKNRAALEYALATNEIPLLYRKGYESLLATA